MAGFVASNAAVLKRYSATSMQRRKFHTLCGAAITSLSMLRLTRAVSPKLTFQPNYLLAACLYGYSNLSQILPEVHKTGATAIDIWPKPHGNQREQLSELGEEKFAAMLAMHDITLGCITQYPLGPFGLQDEMRLAQRLGCHTIVTGAAGPHNLAGEELKLAVQAFVEKMKPHLAVAEETQVTIAIENHAKSLIDTPESLKWLAEFTPSPRLKIALAPYHLPQDSELIAALIRECGPALEVFYAWQHGMGCMTQQPKEQELLQMPGRGELAFTPLLEALADIDFRGWTEIFMHPFPRGIPILESVQEVTAEVNRAREFLSKQS
jgi:sugar phosphate isomerase/epimerase